MGDGHNSEPAGVAPYLRELIRHFADLRDGTHGVHAVSREEKEALFLDAVDFLDPCARQVLDELNTTLLSGSGELVGTGAKDAEDGGLSALWTLTWPEQSRVGIAPVTLEAFFGRNFHHPHLRGGTLGVWPLNIFSASEAWNLLPTLRAIAAADLHNLVFQSSYRIIPAITLGRYSAGL